MSRLNLVALVLGLMTVAWNGRAHAQSGVVPVALDACRAAVTMHGVPQHDAAATFQGGSLEAQVIALCQSLAHRGQRDNTSLDQAFSALGDTNRDGAIDQQEMEAYFATTQAVPQGPAAQENMTPVPGGSTLPAAGSDGEGIRVALLAGVLALLLWAGLRLVSRRRSAS